jgi:hypothetical protein
VRLEPWILAGALALAGCAGGEPESVSGKARVMPKSGVVWARDLANGLGLDEWSVCAELGSYDCVAAAHRITLGGVEPTTLGIDEPLPNASVSAPIAVDRVASTACAERFDMDKAGNPVVFGPILEKDSVAARKEVAENLVRRLLARHPTTDDVANLTALYDTLEPLSTDLVRDWSVGACVVVATSTEALFY